MQVSLSGPEKTPRIQRTEKKFQDFPKQLLVSRTCVHPELALPVAACTLPAIAKFQDSNDRSWSFNNRQKRSTRPQCKLGTISYHLVKPLDNRPPKGYNLATTQTTASTDRATAENAAWQSLLPTPSMQALNEQPQVHPVPKS